MDTNQGFSYTGSSEYNFPNISLQETGIALFDAFTGIGGIDYIPADGDTVTVIAGFDATVNNEVRQFDPAMNNQIYYLVTDVDYGANDRDTILLLATNIPVTYNVLLQRYEGTFVFSNPDDLPNLYLIWDYTDKLDGGTITYSGKRTERIVDADYSKQRGIAGIDYATTSRPVRYELLWNNVTVGDTGYVGLNSLSNYNALINLGIDPKDIKLSYPYNGLVNNGTGQLRFNKFSESSEAQIFVSVPRDNSSFSVTYVPPSLTSFYLADGDADLSTVCSQTPSKVYYHDGSSALPTIGDRIYSDIDGAALYDGNNAYHQINTSGSSAGLYVIINNDGIVILEGSCTCNEIAVPVITASSFVFTIGQSVNVSLEATNNPASWNIITSCEEYLLNGGTTGTIFNYTDCNSVSTDITLNIGQSKLICASAAPTIVGGNGSYTLNGPCSSFVLPKGISFSNNSGLISGSASDECEFSFDVQATNCFGTSATETITISIVSSNNFKPFLIDVENFGNTSAEACAMTSPLYSVLYQNGAGNTPVVGDYIARTYGSQFTAEPFFGGGKWYVVYGTSDVIKICDTGKVCDIYTCP